MTTCAFDPLVGACQPLSALLHLAGAVVYGALTLSLLRRARGRLGPGLSLAIFAISCVSLLAVSGVYHFVPFGDPWRAPLQRVDHAAIFVLIAGTLTPFHVMLFRGSARFVVLGVLWLLAAGAIALKLAYFDALQGGAGLALYVGLSAVGLSSALLLPRRIRLVAFAPMAWGGAAYVTGALLEQFGQPVLMQGVAGPHEFFHATVLLGSAIHWRFLGGIADEATFKRQASVGDEATLDRRAPVGDEAPFNPRAVVPRSHRA